VEKVVSFERIFTLRFSLIEGMIVNEMGIGESHLVIRITMKANSLIL